LDEELDASTIATETEAAVLMLNDLEASLEAVHTYKPPSDVVLLSNTV